MLGESGLQDNSVKALCNGKKGAALKIYHVSEFRYHLVKYFRHLDATARTQFSENMPDNRLLLFISSLHGKDFFSSNYKAQSLGHGVGCLNLRRTELPILFRVVNLNNPYRVPLTRKKTGDFKGNSH